MVSTSQGKSRRQAVHHCPSCGKSLPGPWQGRKAVTAFVIMVLLMAGFIGGKLSTPRDVQLVEERRRLQQDQAHLRQEQQLLAEERRRLAEERKQVTATSSSEAGQRAGSESVVPTPVPSRQEPPVAVGVPPVTPSVQAPSGQTWKNGIGMEFVRIRAGEFQMGSASGDDNEKPVHRVRISKDFYLGKHEVTQAQWQAVMGNNPSRFKGDTLPVEQVSWEDVQQFIQRLNAKEGGAKYRLPTEAEWEYAARARTTTVYSFGAEFADQLGEYAWFSANAGWTTHPVGQKKPNPWGLYDMHGNVWEWVQDWYNTYKSSTSTAVDPKGPSTGAGRVIRGGGWGNVARFCRAACRYGVAPGLRTDSLGFRLLRKVP